MPPPNHDHTPTGPRRGAILVMAIACGIMVGNIYICQPLLDEIARSFGVAEHQSGFVAVAAQIGYAIGILFVLPLADIAEPRRLMRILSAVTTIGLLGAAVAPGIWYLVLAMLVVASATVVPQILIPLAIALAPPERRGRIIGTLQTGLILGILLSRTISGTFASLADTWRAPFLLAAVATGAVFVILPGFVPPESLSRSRPSYWTLLRSLPQLLVHEKLRTSVGLGFCVFGAFSAFWATLAFHLATPTFGLGAAATGLFGLWGAPGAMLAPLAGRLSDRYGVNKVNAGALGFTAVSFLIAGLLGDRSTLALVAAVNLLDFGMQSGQVANQARIFSLGTQIRARVNTVYMVAVFGGGAFGSFGGTLAWGRYGWAGVCAVAGGLVATACIVLVASKFGCRAQR